MLIRLDQLLVRIGAYPWWQVLIELSIIWIVVYGVFRFVQGTRAVGALKGILLVIVTATLLVRILGRQEAFQRLTFLYENFLTLLAITLVVVFQPELRRGLMRLGETPVFRKAMRGGRAAAESISDACEYLSKAKFGALIVIEREVGLKGLVEGGTPLGAVVSARLLQTIFFPGSALHDLAVIVKGDRVEAAGVQLPLAEPAEMPDATLGSRHRAAVGLSKECDAIVVVVSEESGAISVAERGKLERGLTPDQLRELIEARLRTQPAPDASGNADGRAGDGHSGDNGTLADDGTETSEPPDEHRAAAAGKAEG